MKHTILVAAVAVLCAPALAGEQCYYPVEKHRISFWVKDVEGLSEVDPKRILEGMDPQITCDSSPGSDPICTTPWGGRVYLHQEKEEKSYRYYVRGFNDKGGNRLEFTWSLGMTSPMQFVSFARDERATAQCNSLSTAKWHSYITSYTDESDRPRYTKGSTTRAVVIKKSEDVYFGAPVPASSGDRGNF